jgi:hypothetical protein
MKPMSLLLVVTAAAAVAWSLANAQTPLQILQAGCAEDARKFCSNVQSGGGRILACLKQNKDSLSDKCKQAAAQASRMASEGAQGVPAPTAPPSGATSPAGAADALIASPAATSTPASAAGVAASTSKPARASNASSGAKSPTKGADGSYLVMKKVQVTGPGPDAAHPTLPAYDLMIPSTWKIQGGVVFGGSPSGCLSDLYAINLQATSADGSTIFAAAPDYS